MNRRCDRQDCYEHEGESCANGLMQVSKCPNFIKGLEKEEGTDEGPVTDSARVPWSGSSLGLSDLLTLTSRAKSITVGILGAHDSGKTTLLLGNYLQCLQGRDFVNAQFSGSYTLGAWETLASWVRLHDVFQQPSFPPHTPRSAARTPGLLHFALRSKDDGSFRDVLLTDAPGEWFSHWAIRKDSPESSGARWIAERSDIYLIFADCEKLSGQSRGKARNELRQLIERLSPYVNNRPVLLIWSKIDVCKVENLSPGIRDAIRRTLTTCIPGAAEVQVTVSEPESFAEAMDLALNSAWNPELAERVVEPVSGRRPFSSFRGHNHGVT